jgi:hypothetical protein
MSPDYQRWARSVGLTCTLTLLACASSPRFWPYRQSYVGAPQIVASAQTVYPGDLATVLGCKHLQLGDLSFDEAEPDDVGEEAAQLGGTHVALVESSVQHSGSKTTFANVGQVGVARTRDTYDTSTVWRVYRVELRDMGCLPPNLRLGVRAVK